jgi:hypothetical protein
MHDHLVGPTWGNVVIIVLASAVTLACIWAMLRMLIRPGEDDPAHPKRAILREDR